MQRFLYKIVPLLLLLLILTGCSAESISEPIDPNNMSWYMYPVFWLSESMDWFAELLWGSYGLSILVVTIIIRFIILPLTLKQYRSSKQMQEIQPELNKLRTKYKTDQQKLQEETMKLFQKHGVNPLAGCFPILVQMPILIALYNAIIRNPDIKSHTFLWMELGAKDPYYILPVVAAATTFLQQKIMMDNSPTPANPMMNSLLFIFPVLIFVMAISFASALPLYWVYSNIFTIVQTYFIYGGSQKGGLAKK